MDEAGYRKLLVLTIKSKAITCNCPMPGESLNHDTALFLVAPYMDTFFKPVLPRGFKVRNLDHIAATASKFTDGTSNVELPKAEQCLTSII